MLHNQGLTVKTDDPTAFNEKWCQNRVLTSRDEFNRIHSVGRRLYSSADGKLSVTPHLSEFYEADRFRGLEQAQTDHATVVRHDLRGAVFYNTPIAMVMNFAKLSKTVRIVMPVRVYAKLPCISELVNSSLGNHLGFLCSVPRSWLHLLSPTWFNRHGHSVVDQQVDVHAVRADNTVFKMSTFSPKLSAQVQAPAGTITNSDLLGAVGEFFFDSACKGLTRKELKLFMKRSKKSREKLSIMANPREFAPLGPLGYAMRVWKVHVEEDNDLDEF